MSFAFKHPWWTFLGGLFGLGAIRAGFANLGYARYKATHPPTPSGNAASPAPASNPPAVAP